MEEGYAYFFYSNQLFEVDLNLFNQHSIQSLNEGNTEEEPFFLVSEFDPELQHPEETIEAFINFFHTDEIDITPANVFSIKFLSHKFDIPALIIITEEYINNEDNEHEILAEIFSHPENLYEEQEKFISKRFEHLLEDDRLNLFSISQLYRIIPEHLRRKQIENSQLEKRILDFLINKIDNEKKQALILVQLFKFSQKGQKRFYEEVINKNDSVGLNCIEKVLVEEMIDLQNYQEQKEKEHEEYKKALNEQITDIEKRMDDILNRFSKENEDIRNQVKLERLYQNQKIEHLKRTIVDTSDFYSNPSYEVFNKLQCDTQCMILSEMNKKYSQNQQIENLYNLVNYLMKVKLNSNYQFDDNQLIYIQTKDNKQTLFSSINIEKIIIPSSIIDALITNSPKNKKEFIRFVNKFDEIYACIEYPSSKYHQIMDYIIQMNESNEFKLKTEIRITEIDEKEKPFYQNKYINSVIFEQQNEIISNGLTIPSSITSIGDYAFSGCSSLTEITIPSSVTSIGDSAFSGCSSLTEITIPSSITSIGDSAFSGCSSLTEITIPSSATSIGNYAFSGCSSLTEITIPSSVTLIGDYAFSSCSSLTEITIPSSATSIGNYAFSGCSSLTEISIPSSVTSIGNYAFSGCSSLTEITIPSSITSIGDSAFSGCSSLTEITIPSSVTSIGDSAFSGCSSLTEITIPSSVTSIGNYAFSGCSSLTEITIPSSVTSIGDYAFSSCSSLTEITIPSSATSIGNYAFTNCSSLIQISIPSSIASIGEGIFRTCWKLKKIQIIPNKNERIKLINDTFLIFKSSKSENFDTLIWTKNNATTANIPPFITKIGSSAFDGCKSLTQISIPSSITSIGDDIFTLCWNLEKIQIIPNKNERIKFIDDKFLAFKSSTSENFDTLVWTKNNVTTANIPPFITKIGSSAFDGCKSLTQISIPSSVTSIGSSAFDGCSSLKEIQIPSSVTSIGNFAFYHCSSLTQISIPSSVTSIGNSAFNGCSSLTQISIPSSVTSIGSSAFSKCTSLTQISIPASIKNIEDIGLPSKTKIIRT